ncbi:MAG TPA: response regulator transcription factor [Opitutaceae bacterium]|jgi:DNA-binding NarL/FixJ family response regulator|nr:response regulator transcription factor [Opitutaceae bacterium]
MKLMIVDDHPGMRKMIRQIVGTPDDVVCECSTGTEAVDQAALFQPDWVTMDLRMPGIGGFEATRAISEIRPAATIVIVSTYDFHALRRIATEAGAAAFVTKENLHHVRGILLQGRTNA